MSISIHHICFRSKTNFKDFPHTHCFVIILVPPNWLREPLPNFLKFKPNFDVELIPFCCLFKQRGRRSHRHGCTRRDGKGDQSKRFRMKQTEIIGLQFDCSHWRLCGSCVHVLSVAEHSSLDYVNMNAWCAFIPSIDMLICFGWRSSWWGWYTRTLCMPQSIVVSFQKTNKYIWV